MIGQATAHRRANAFAQAIEDADLEGGHGEGADGSPGGPAGSAGGSPGGSPASGERDQGSTGGHGAHAADRRADPEQVSMVAVAAALSKRPRPAMDPERKTVQRAQLIAAMEQALADGSFRGTAAGRVPEQRSAAPASGLRKLAPRAPRSRLSRRLAVGGLTMGVAAGAFGGVAAASTNALPGDTLYGLKRGMEDLKLDMAGSDASRGKVYLDLASTRMQEARRLMDRGRGGPLDDESVAEVRRALSGMHQEASEGHRLLTQAYEKDGSLEPMELLNTFAESHRQSWADLRGKLPSQLTDVSDQVSSIFDAIDAEVAPLSLPHASGTHTPAREGDSGGSGGQYSSGPTDSPSSTAGRQDGSGSGTSASPSPSGSTGDNLFTSGGLLGPVPTGPGTPTALPTTPSHSVVLPPLLPGLLPGLDDLSGSTDGE